MKVVALHGGYLGPEDLRRDMGDPDWVDMYILAKNAMDVLVSLPWEEPVVLIGYSKGGAIIGELSNMVDNIAGAVLYESPLFDDEPPGGDFPVLWIRNDYKARGGREAEFADTFDRWCDGRSVTKFKGVGKHFQWRWGWPPIRHDWDQTLNPFIRAWIRKLDLKLDD